jgi:branched-chain amino acid transport system ATP-binding protein
VLKILNLESGYGNLRVLHGVSLHVKSGEIVAIIGANGAGKTTLLNSIAGIVRPRGGAVVFDQADLRTSSTASIVASGCVLVPEGRQVFASMSIEENLMLGGLTLYKKDKPAVARELNAVYELFPVLSERKHQFAGTLSGGEQQMLAIGRALMSRPRLLMLDEPSMGLAPLIVKEIFRTILSLRNRGTTILLVEQNSRAALTAADRGYVMETGTIVLEGAAKDLLNNRDVQRAYLGKEYKRINE